MSLSQSIADALGTSAEEVKRAFSQEQRDRMAEEGQAMEGGGFPIATEADLRNAIQAIGRAKDRAATIRHIIDRARALGLTDLIPEPWWAEVGAKKDDEPETIEWKAADGAPTYEYKVFPITGFKVLQEEDGIVEAIVSVTGIVDRVKDIIEPGAYEQTLVERIPKGVWSHDWASPVSKTLEAKELLPGDPDLPKTLRNGDPWPREAGALKIKMQFNLDGERGRQAYADVKFFGDQMEWSVGYNVPVGGAVVERKTGIRRIKKMDLFEYSGVLFGAMPEAVTALGVKSAQEALRLLREQETKDGEGEAAVQPTLDETEEVSVEESDPVEPEETEEAVEEEPDTDDGIDDETMQLLFDAASAAIDAEIRAAMTKVAGQEVTPGDAAAAERLRRYWAEGEGAAKIRWGTPGDWKRCRAHLEKYMPGRANGYCQLLHKRATGIYTGDRANPGGNGKGDEVDVETKFDPDQPRGANGRWIDMIGSHVRVTRKVPKAHIDQMGVAQHQWGGPRDSEVSGTLVGMGHSHEGRTPLGSSPDSEFAWIDTGEIIQRGPSKGKRNVVAVATHEIENMENVRAIRGKKKDGEPEDLEAKDVHTGSAPSQDSSGFSPPAGLKDEDYLTCKACGARKVKRVSGKVVCASCGEAVAKKFKAEPASAAGMLRDLADSIEGGEDVDRAAIESVIKALQSTLNSTQKEPSPDTEEGGSEEEKSDEINILGDVLQAERFMLDLDEVVPPFPDSPPEGKFDPSQPRIPGGRAGGGRWTSLLTGRSVARQVGELRLNDEQMAKAVDSMKGIPHTAGRKDGKGTVDDPIDCGNDLDKATEMLAQGKHIRLHQPDEVATLVQRLAKVSAEMRKKGVDAPDFNLCNVSVPGTNLFCHDNKGIPRAKMPQLSGTPSPGSIADSLPKDKKGEVDAKDLFRAALIKRGIKVTPKTVKASHLRATQSELVGDKVGGIAGAMEAGKVKDAPIFVTRDGYVIDGHHRWAAKIAIDLEDGKLGDTEMPVEVVDMDIGEAIDFANAFADGIGIAPKGTGAQAEAIVKPKG